MCRQGFGDQRLGRSPVRRTSQPGNPGNLGRATGCDQYAIRHYRFLAAIGLFHHQRVRILKARIPALQRNTGIGFQNAFIFDMSQSFDTFLLLRHQEFSIDSCRLFADTGKWMVRLQMRHMRGTNEYFGWYAAHVHAGSPHHSRLDYRDLRAGFHRTNGGSKSGRSGANDRYLQRASSTVGDGCAIALGAHRVDPCRARGIRHLSASHACHSGQRSLN